MKVECKICGEEFEVSDSRYERNENFYCSRQCYSEYLSYEYRGENNPHYKEKIEKECPECGRKFEVPPSQNSRRRFCSVECMDENRRKIRGEEHPLFNRVEVKCSNCGKKIGVILSRKNYWNNQFCNRECYFQWMKKSDFSVGANNSSWKGGSEFFYGSNWIKQRRKARERDNYTCQECGTSENGRKHDVHHKISLNNFDNPKEGNKLENLITLCRSCHMKVEREIENGI